MAWDRDDIEWVIKLLLVATGWWGSIICVSFVMFRHIPVFTIALCIVALTCYVFFYSPIDAHRQWKRRPDKLALFFHVGYTVFMLYLVVTFMTILHGYYNTGVLPDHYNNLRWPERWYAPLVYVGAAMSPVIYTAMLVNRKKGG